MQNNIHFKLKEASVILGVSPKDLQNLVQFGVIQPPRQNRFFVFDSATLLKAKVAFYLKESLGTSVQLLARFTTEIFKDGSLWRPDQPAIISIFSRPLGGKEPVRIDIPMRELVSELKTRIPVVKSTGGRAKSGEHTQWKEKITGTFEAAATDLKGITEKEILNEIKRFRAERKKSPEITVVALPEDKTA